jgi:hypothetical protein
MAVFDAGGVDVDAGADDLEAAGAEEWLEHAASARTVTARSERGVDFTVTPAAGAMLTHEMTNWSDAD